MRRTVNPSNSSVCSKPGRRRWTLTAPGGPCWRGSVRCYQTARGRIGLSCISRNDNCWRVRVVLPEVSKFPGGEEYRTVVVLVSILTPIYVLYSSFQQHQGGEFSPARLFYEEVPETKPYADKVEALVRSRLHVHRLPIEILFTPVPDIQCGNVSLNEARIIDCLFTDDQW
jgi:hypothetical protein